MYKRVIRKLSSHKIHNSINDAKSDVLFFNTLILTAGVGVNAVICADEN
jgi:hypothetical protein